MKVGVLIWRILEVPKKYLNTASQNYKGKNEITSLRGKCDQRSY